MLVYMSICLYLHVLYFIPCFLCLDLSFSCVVWLDPHVSMLVYMSICLDLHALCFMPCFPMLCPSFLFYDDVRVACSHACMMLLAMPCLDLCVYVCSSMFMC